MTVAREPATGRARGGPSLTGAVRRHSGATVVLALYLLLGTVYSVVDPVLESSDEVFHYPLVAHLAAGGGLPVQRPGEETLWLQEGSQPPLYYLLAAAATAWIDTGDLQAVRYPNPHAAIGVPLAPDNKNMVLHTAGESFPWRGTVLAVHAVRLLSVLLGAVTVLCTYALGLMLFPGRPRLAVLAMCFTAFLPMFLFISASVNNDSLVTALASLATVLLARVARDGYTGRRMVMVGVVIGLACLSKLSGLGLLPLVGVALLLAPGYPRGSTSGVPVRRWRAVWRWLRPRVVAGAITLGIAVLVAGWWYWRNWRLYGDLTGLSAMLAVAGRRPHAPSVGQLLAEFEGWRISFWGLFGGVNVLVRPAWVYRLLDGVAGLAAVGLLAWLVTARRRLRSARPLLVPAAWVAIMVSLIRWTSLTLASQGRLVFPALSAISCLAALGLVGWLPPRLGRAAAWLLGAGILLLAAAVPFTSIAAAYPRPVLLSAADVPATMRPFPAEFGGSIRLLGFELEPAEAYPGQALRLVLYWESVAPMAEDFSLFVQVQGDHGQRLAQHDTWPAGGAYATSLWRPGQVLRDVHVLTIRPDAVVPVAAQVEVGWYRLGTRERLVAEDEAGRTFERVVIARVRLAALQPTAATAAAQSVVANLGGQVQLLDYSLPSLRVSAGTSVPLVLHWRPLRRPDGDYTVFVHLVDEAGNLVCQADGPPMQGQFPTSFWSPEDVLEDPHTIDVPADVTPGAYRLSVGLYEAESGQRLPVLGADGSAAGDGVLLVEVEVVAP